MHILQIMDWYEILSDLTGNFVYIGYLAHSMYTIKEMFQ